MRRPIIDDPDAVARRTDRRRNSPTVRRKHHLDSGATTHGKIPQTAGQSQPLMGGPNYEVVAGWDSQEIPPGS